MRGIQHDGSADSFAFFESGSTHIPSSLDLVGHGGSDRSNIRRSQLLARHTLLALLIPVVWIDIIELQLNPVESDGGIMGTDRNRVTEGIEERCRDKDTA